MIPFPPSSRVLLISLVLLLSGGCAMTPVTDAGPAPDEVAALYWAADTGNPDAQFRLGRVYGRGGHGVVQDYDRALAWLSEAAANGDQRARALYDQWTSGDKARDLVVAAQSALANDHEAYGVPLLERLAEAGVAEAAYALGRYYLEAKPPDAGRARPWLKLGASAGDANSRYLLGVLWASESQGASRPGRAAQYWRACAAQAHAMCQYSLGLLYMTGKGVEQDPARGRALIGRAAGQGYARAVEWVEQLERHCAAPATADKACP